MILQSLFQYYQRKAADPESGIAPLGFEWKPIHFICVLSEKAKFLGFEDTREMKKGKLLAKPLLVPSIGVSKGNGIKSNLLWENAEYVFGVPTKDKSKPGRLKLQAAAFRDKIRSTRIIAELEPVQILLTFLDDLPLKLLRGDELWSQITEPNSLIGFKIDGVGVLTELQQVREYQPSQDPDDAQPGYCLITGDKSLVKKLLPPIKGVRGANSSGALLIAVNNEVKNGRNGGATPAFASYLKQKGYNSPVGYVAADGFAKALNYLLRSDSVNENKFTIGDSTTVFWSEKSNWLEDDFFSYWSEKKDDPDRGVLAMQTLLNSPYTGASVPDGTTHFYVLGLAPNTARISIRFWHTGTIAEFSNVIRQHFQDLLIDEPKNRRDAQQDHRETRGSYALSVLLKSVATREDAENIPPNLAGDTMRAILIGRPYPETLMLEAIRRIRASHEVKRPQVALLKAYLNRKRRFQTNSTEEVIQVSLDPNCTGQGYLLGRLFAVLEQIQLAAHDFKEPNAGIRDRFWGSFSSSPVATLPILLNVSRHHLAKLAKNKKGVEISLDSKMREVMQALPAQIRPHLSLEEQCGFAIGYYHQRQSFFTKPTPKDSDISRGPLS